MENRVNVNFHFTPGWTSQPNDEDDEDEDDDNVRATAVFDKSTNRISSLSLLEITSTLPIDSRIGGRIRSEIITIALILSTLSWITRSKISVR
ncbi:hypothetical protein M0802_002245 [Mischocyttarus mexicanus]|nr:hypothetical protein M0802_002245 [Mischocyttarus mexicanus]